MTRNRLLIIVGVLVVILIGVSVYTFAILLPNVGQAAVSSVTPTPTGTVATTRTAKARKITGTIQSLGASSMVILLHSGKTVTVNVDGTTKYNSSNGSATFSDLKVGQTVEVKGHADPNDSTAVLALSIVIKPP